MAPQALDELKRLAQEGLAYIGRRDRRGMASPELLALLAACERAAALDKFLAEHAPTIRSWLCPSNGENPSEDDAAIVACLEALERLEKR